MKILHISHHAGCFAEIEHVGASLGHTVTSLRFDDGYNIGPARADSAWDRHRETIRAHDLVLTSDTAPLARMVLQHLDEYDGRLVIWVCNRFDYRDEATNDCGFPDPAYYDLMRRAIAHPRVAVVPYTAFEHVYARRKGVPIGRRVIKPTGACNGGAPAGSLIPEAVDRAATLFVPPYHNDTILVDLEARARDLGIRVYRGRYAGPADLRGFRGVLHIPYSWSTLAFFENVNLGLPYLVPSRRFMQSLAKQPGFWWPDLDPRRGLFARGRSDGRAAASLRELRLSEWYCRENAAAFCYFDSWDELSRRAARPEYLAARSRALESFARSHTQTMLERWNHVLGPP